MLLAVGLRQRGGQCKQGGDAEAASQLPAMRRGFTRTPSATPVGG